MDIPNANGFRWVTQDLSAYKGQHAAIEFTTAKDSPFAVAMVVQGDQPPSLGKVEPFLLSGKFGSP